MSTPPFLQPHRTSATQKLNFEIQNEILKNKEQGKPAPAYQLQQLWQQSSEGSGSKKYCF